MRLFIGISPTEEIRRTLVKTQDYLRRHGIRGNWSPEENLHMTLAFIGEHPDPEQVLEAMGKAEFTGFPIVLDEIGLFNNNVLWAGVHGSEQLETLVRRLHYELARADIPFDRKAFLPHITLVRNVDDSRGVPETRVPEVSMTVSGISLFRSDRGKRGMAYTEIGTVGAASPRERKEA